MKNVAQNTPEPSASLQPPVVGLPPAATPTPAVPAPTAPPASIATPGAVSSPPLAGSNAALVQKVLTNFDHQSGSLPPLRMPSSTGSSHPPTPYDTKSDIGNTTERDSSYATALATKVGGSEPAIMTYKPSLAGSPIATPTAVAETSHVKKNRKTPLKAIAGTMMLLLLVGGLASGFYLQLQQQDTRQKAASEQVTNTELYTTATEWSDFNARWKTFMAGEKSWQEYVAYAQGEGARYKCDATIMQVKNETLYGCDLNALFVLLARDQYVRPSAIDPQDSSLNRVLDELITDSGVLQLAQEKKGVSLNPAVYNSSQKNTEDRFALLTQYKEEFRNTLVKKVDFEMVTIYFHNEQPPAIGVAASQPAAKAKMDALYSRLKSGSITMAQAGDEIRADTITGDTSGISLSKLDKLYKENAYIKASDYEFDGRFFTDESLDEELRSLGEGQMSTVRLCKDYAFTKDDVISGAAATAPMVDSCYIIFKVNAIKVSDDQSLSVGSSNEVQEQILQRFKKDTSLKIK